MSSTNYYDILGISKDASVDEIKKAFRRQAVKHHPDQGGDEAKFKEINRAYEVLSNPEKKQRYDQFGEAGLGGNRGGFNQGQAYGDFQDVNFDFGGGFGDIFSSFFGGRRDSSPQSGRDIEVSLDLDFKEAVFGVNKELSLALNDVCSQCQGQQAQPGTEIKTCPDCKGSGQHTRVTRTILGNVSQQIVCPACSGNGKQITKPCSACKGRGVSQQKKVVNLVVPPGIADGQTIRLREHGETNRKGVAGDLYIVISVKPDKHFTRDGDLILSEETIDVTQAILGDKIKIKTIDGTAFLKIPPGTQSGVDFRLEKKGVPHIKGSGRGDHIVRIHVAIPDKLNGRQKKIIKQFQESL